MKAMTKYRCWELDVEDEEDGDVLTRSDFRSAAKEYADHCYHREPTEWCPRGVDIMVRDLDSQKVYKCRIGTEWEPSFYLMECQEIPGGEHGTTESTGD